MSTKRGFDLAIGGVALAMAFPVLAIAMMLIWMGDGRSPLFRGARVGKDDRDFPMLKLRTMVAGADAIGGNSTPAIDPRLTSLGRFLRRWKIDELPQLWNVVRGEMSLVGPRPQVRPGGVDRYTSAERTLLSVRPGMTDLASIVFSDEGEILKDAVDPDARYDQVIRPWKNRLGLVYVRHHDVATDAELLWLTLLAIVAKSSALRGVAAILERWEADPELRRVCLRNSALPRGDPPGAVA